MARREGLSKLNYDNAYMYCVARLDGGEAIGPVAKRPRPAPAGWGGASNLV